MRTASRALAILFLGLGFSPAAVSQTYTYRITQLETRAGPERVFSQALNNSGNVTGQSLSRCIDCSAEAFLWIGMKKLSYFGPLFVSPDLQWVRSDGFDINYLGQVTGEAVLSDTFVISRQQSRAFFWDGATKTILGTLGGDYSVGKAINASGHIAGTSSIAGDARRAFLWDGTTMRDLGTLGGNFSAGAGINASGHVTGSSNNADGQSRAFLWDGSTMLDLGTLGGSRSFGSAVNAKDQVTGRATTTDDAETRAFLWQDGLMEDIGTLGGFSEGSAINNAGQVVGFFSSSGVMRAFLWENGRMRNVNNLDFANDPLKPFVKLSWATDINNIGQMVIRGSSELSNIQSFLVSPSYTLSAFLAPTRNSTWRLGSTVRIAIQALDAKGVRIPDERAKFLLAEPGCRVQVSATGAQSLASTCMKYNETTNEFWFDWKLAGTGTGTAAINVRVNYGAPGPLRVQKFKNIIVTT